jgi:hypothetical protein
MSFTNVPLARCTSQLLSIARLEASFTHARMTIEQPCAWNALGRRSAAIAHCGRNPWADEISDTCSNSFSLSMHWWRVRLALEARPHAAFLLFALVGRTRRTVTSEKGLASMRHLQRRESAQYEAKIVAAVDSSGVVHAKVFFIWDDKYFHYFLSARDRKEAHLGAVSLLLWTGIESAHSYGLCFDFVGGSNGARY